MAATRRIESPAGHHLAVSGRDHRCSRSVQGATAQAPRFAFGKVVQAGAVGRPITPPHLSDRLHSIAGTIRTAHSGTCTSPGREAEQRSPCEPGYRRRTSNAQDARSDEPRGATRGSSTPCPRGAVGTCYLEAIAAGTIIQPTYSGRRAGRADRRGPATPSSISMESRPRARCSQSVSKGSVSLARSGRSSRRPRPNSTSICRPINDFASKQMPPSTRKTESRLD